MPESSLSFDWPAFGMLVLTGSVRAQDEPRSVLQFSGARRVAEESRPGDGDAVGGVARRAGGGVRGAHGLSGDVGGHGRSTAGARGGAVTKFGYSRFHAAQASRQGKANRSSVTQCFQVTPPSLVVRMVLPSNLYVRLLGSEMAPTAQP